MEKTLDRHLDDIMNSPGVTGVMCTDHHGLALGAKGTCQLSTAGQVSNIAQQAASLHPESPLPPVVCIESDSGNLLIKSHGNITMAINKLPSS